MTAVIALLGNPLARWVGILMLLAAALLWARWDAADQARVEQRADALQRQETTRENADAAARNAERTGAGQLLDAGRF